jgi:hypothetical protein
VYQSDVSTTHFLDLEAVICGADNQKTARGWMGKPEKDLHTAQRGLISIILIFQIKDEINIIDRTFKSNLQDLRKLIEISNYSFLL